MSCDRVTNFLKNNIIKYGLITVDYLLWVKVFAEDTYNRCKKKYINNTRDWTFLDVKIRNDTGHPKNYKRLGNIMTINYVYDGKTYNIVQEYRARDDKSIMNKFPLYTYEELNKYKNNKKFGNIKIISAEYDNKDVTEHVKSYLGPMNDFYYSLIEKSPSNPELDNVFTVKVTGMDAWWILPEMLGDLDKKLIITDQFLNEYTFGPFDKVLLNNDKII